ncbi:MAG: glycosyltransferase [Pseudomonadota bacterium]
MLILTALAAFAWVGLLLVPWQAHRTRERLQADTAIQVNGDLSDITVVIPARNEAESLPDTLARIVHQGPGIKVIVVDDNSDDGTAELARSVDGLDLQIIDGEPLPEGWAGKMWALEQGTQSVNTELTLLMDADIGLMDGVLLSMREKLHQERLDFLSLMAELRMQSFWERLLMPAYIYFFKLLPPVYWYSIQRQKVFGFGQVVLG